MKSTASRPLPRLLLVAGILALVPGCLNVTLGHVTKGNPIDRNCVARLEPGRSTLADVLSLLGAPLEVHGHPEGRLLVYRHRARNRFEFGLDAGTLTRFYDVTQITSSLLGNIKFTLQRTHVDEDRLVVLFDRNHILVGIGFRDRTDKLPVF